MTIRPRINTCGCLESQRETAFVHDAYLRLVGNGAGQGGSGARARQAEGRRTSGAQGPRARDGACNFAQAIADFARDDFLALNKCRGSVPIWRRLKGKDQGPEQGAPRSRQLLDRPAGKLSRR